MQTAQDRALEHHFEAPSAVVVNLGDVLPTRTEWLWPGRLPIGKLTVFDGDPGLGKSTLMLDVAAKVTTGSPFCDGHRPAVGNVVILSAEDGLADTIRPRLDAADADPSRVLALDAVHDPEFGQRPFSIPGDLSILDDVIAESRADLVIVDVLNAYLAARVDSYRDQDVRGALMPLARLAERHCCAIVVLRHLAKSGGANAIYRGGGSIGIIGAARCGLLVAPDPDDESRMVLAVTKSNLAAIPPALAYRLTSDDERGCARVVWDGETTHKANDLLTVASPDDDSPDAVAVLAELLADGPLWVKDAVDAMAGAGFSKDQAKRAKSKLRVRSVKVGAPGDPESGWKWEMPLRERATPQESEEGGSLDPAPFAPFGAGSLPSERQRDGWDSPTGGQGDTEMPCIAYGTGAGHG